LPSGRNSRVSGTGSKASWATVIPSFLYLLVCLLCLVRWDAVDPWSRVDLFSGGYLGVRALAAIHSIISSRKVFSSKPLRREWWGITSDQAVINWVVLLMLADLTVFLDYGHWQLTPGLKRRGLQSLGLGLYALAAVWQMWADTYLARYFADDQSSKGTTPKPISEGPFRYVRHPRYAGAMVGKLAFALVFASGLGWLFAAAWILMLYRKVLREETHLRDLFGAEYDAYACHTARLLPGVY
jgi:protein-S-isoprenylcysteine O-methyltransferase Ste14